MTVPARQSAGPRPLVPGWGWVSARELDPFYRAIGQVMRDTAGDQPTGPWGTPADLEETDDAYLLEMDLPGASRDSITIDVTAHEIRITGEVKPRANRGLVHHQGRHFGQFDQLVNLSAEVDPSKTEAKLTDGVLTVWAPKSEATKPRKVEIKVS